MGIKKISLIFLSLFSLQAFGLIQNNFHQKENIKREQKSFRLKTGYENLNQLSKKRIFKLISSDPLKRVPSIFRIPKYFRSATEFWFSIYTHYSTHHIVIHDNRNLSLIYDVINLKKGSPRTVKKRVKKITQILKNMSRGKSNSKDTHFILNILKSSNQKIPSNTKKRSVFYRKLAKQIRTQVGQKNRIITGLKNIIPFTKSINKYFKLFEIPKELIAISFIESSFNTKARSKVGASGVWQFMKYTGKTYMKINKGIDQRLNPLLASISAFQLLKQNKKILGRWDLAITSYNSGTKHVLKALGKNKKIKKLEDVFKKYQHAHLGFASKNFYSEFLALVYALSYKNNLLIDDSFATDQKNSLIHPYVAKCSIVPSWFLSQLKKQGDQRINQFNTHFKSRSLKQKHRKGLIFLSSIPLNPKRYIKVPDRNLWDLYPKNWYKLALNQSCSRR